MKFWQNRLRLISLVLFALMTTRCGIFGGGVEPEVLEPAELTIVTYEQSSGWGQAEEAAIEHFLESHPQIEIERQAFSSSLDNYLSHTPPPDLVAESYIYPLHEAIANDQLLDLNEIWTDNNLNQVYPAAFQTASQVDGKHYFMPLGYSWAGIYYNKAIFEQLGLKPPKTWEEFMQLCDTLRNYGIRPLALSRDDAMMGMLWFVYLNLRLNGPEFHAELLRGQIPFTDARVRTVFETWQSLIDGGYFIDRPEIMTDLDAMTALIQHDDLPGEKAAMVLATSYHNDDLPQPFQAQLDFFRFPIMEPSLPVAEVVEPYGYVIPKGSVNIPQTLAFLSYMSSAEGQTFLAQAAGGALNYAPIHQDVNQNILSPGVQQGQALVEEADALTPNFILSYPVSMWGELWDGYELYAGRNKTFDEYLATLEESRQKSLAAGDFFESQ